MDVDSTEAHGEDGYEEVLGLGDDEAHAKMTAKVPPAFDGHTQIQVYFAYEENVEEWVTQGCVDHYYVIDSSVEPYV